MLDCARSRCQKYEVMFRLAQELDTTLVYLSFHSPHLNLIEWLWHFIRKECLYSTYYADFTSFEMAISDVTNIGNLNKKKRFRSLIISKAQSFEKVQFLDN